MELECGPAQSYLFLIHGGNLFPFPLGYCAHSNQETFPTPTWISSDWTGHVKYGQVKSCQDRSCHVETGPGFSVTACNDHEEITVICKKLQQRRLWQSGILKSLVEYVQHRVCFVNIQFFLQENVVFFVCVFKDNAVYIKFIMWDSISGLEVWYHFRFNISCGVAVTVVRGHQKSFR